MNLIVNAHERQGAPRPTLTAIALRVRDAGQACAQHSLDLGAWDMPTRASAMELNIPGIHGVGDSLIYFVDRYRDFSIYDVDFVFDANANREPPALAGLHYFGVVQSDLRRPHARLGRLLPATCSASRCCRAGQYFGVLPKGTLLESPCHKFYLQLIEPPPGAEEIHWEEALVRIGLGAPRRAGGDAGAARSAAWCSSTAARCSRATRARSPRSTSAA